METREIIIAGFGGQGVMSMGKLLVEGAMKENKHSSWLPSYGPEMRGGTANCHVVISNEPIISPIVTHPTDLLVLNEPSFNKFKNELTKNGNILINHDLFDSDHQNDYHLYKIRSNNQRINMVMLGAFIKLTGALSALTLINLIKEQYREPALSENLMAFEYGQSLL